MKHKKTFVGRSEELEKLNGVLALKKSAMVVIKGRRRVGKSRLVSEFARNKIFLSFAGMAPTKGVTAQDQYDAFARSISSSFNIPPFTFSDWLDGFAHITHNLRDQQTVILLDEISWMGYKDPTFLPKLKIWWGGLSEARSNVILVLCGSVSTWIEENIIKSTAFFGRISLHITLQPLSLSESYQMMSDLGIHPSSYEFFRLLSITGGIPWYIEHIRPDLSIDENIKSLCFSPNGLLVQEFNMIFHDLFAHSGEVHKKIVRTLVSGAKTYSDIREELGYGAGGGLSPYIDSLIDSGYITKHQSWVIKTGKSSTKSLFRLSDNYLRFYLKVIEPNLSKIDIDAFIDVSLASMPGWNSIMGLQVENLLLGNRRILLKSIGIHAQDVVADSPFLQRKTTSSAGAQIDYLVQTSTNTLYVCEFTFSRNEIGSEVIKDIRTKIGNLDLPKGFSAIAILFHFGGVSDSVIDSRYFYRIIDINDFLK